MSARSNTLLLCAALLLLPIMVHGQPPPPRLIPAPPAPIREFARILSGNCSGQIFEIRTTYPGDDTLGDSPDVTVRYGSNSRRYEKTEPFVADLFASPSIYQFRVTCLEYGNHFVMLIASGVALDGDAPRYQQAVVSFSPNAAVLDYVRPHALDYKDIQYYAR